jgi:hypothetical protein
MADAMNLRDWEIVIHPTLTDKMRAQMHGGDYEAWIEPEHHRHFADLWFSRGFVQNRSIADKRHTVVHELLHLHHAREEHLLEEMLTDAHDWESAAMAKRWWTQANEYAVNAITDFIAPYLPLPNWPQAVSDELIAMNPLTLPPRWAVFAPPAAPPPRLETATKKSAKRKAAG